MNTLNKPHIPTRSEPSGDDDPTGVRALLSSLPEPDPMPAHLVERINASLAAEQAQRAATSSSSPVTPLLATARRRPRLMFAIAGAAAAVVLVTAVGTNMLTGSQTTATSNSAGIDTTSSRGGPISGAAPSATGGAPAVAGGASTPSLVQIGQSGTRYTQADFVTQARTLRGTTPGPIRPQTAELSGVGPAGTPVGLRDCLNAIGADGAQVVRADVAFYEGRPAVIIVATTNGISMAYAVGRQCSHTNAAVLRAATPLS